MDIEPCNYEERGEAAESCQIARSSFLRLISELHPECIYDLSHSVFPEFVFLVCERFQDELLGGEGEKEFSGSNVFATLFVKALQKVAGDDATNKSIGDVACITFSSFQKLDLRTLRSAFPNWGEVHRSGKAKVFCHELSAWSTRWHLDADWCRDHAIVILRDYLLDEYLKWSLLCYTTFLTDIYEKGLAAATTDAKFQGFVAIYLRFMEVIRNHKDWRIGYAWNDAANDITTSVLWSRVGLAVKVYGNGGPQPFEFKWRQHAFTRPGFNRLVETQSRYKRRMELEFRLLLNEAERTALRKLLEEDTTSDINVPLHHGVLERFKKDLKEHVNLSLSQTEAATKQLVKTKKRPQLRKHLRLTVDYQLYSGRSLNEVSEGQLDSSTISRAISDCLSLIGLNKRPDAQPGRKLGSKNTYDKILKTLGH